ncbi:MAG: hypothetical protein A4E61_00618 [Syntrophorhabdus sp. PtaB.Bin184]|nr:MAG: hypothetical protein A4E61_00618 [Syntrophorhabdus sp. PtaB.Bin184]
MPTAEPYSSMTTARWRRVRCICFSRTLTSMVAGTKKGRFRIFSSSKGSCVLQICRVMSF